MVMYSFLYKHSVKLLYILFIVVRRIGHFEDREVVGTMFDLGNFSSREVIQKHHPVLRVYLFFLSNFLYLLHLEGTR
jgi:hypothetical protein